MLLLFPTALDVFRNSLGELRSGILLFFFTCVRDERNYLLTTSSLFKTLPDLKTSSQFETIGKPDIT